MKKFLLPIFRYWRRRITKMKLTYEDGYIFDILGKPWILRFVTSKDEKLIEFVRARGLEFAGLCVPSEEGGTIFIRLDYGNPRESLRHELCEAFLSEIVRELHKPPREEEKDG